MKKLFRILATVFLTVVLLSPAFAARFPSGTTDQYVYFVAVDATDFTTRETSLTTPTVYRSRNNGTATAMTTPTIAAVDATNMPGVFSLLLDEDMTLAAGNDTEAMVFHIAATEMAPVTLEIELYRPKITGGETLTVSSGTGNSAVQSIAANAITSGSIAASAMNGKGDWNVGKTGYSLTQAFPSNFSSLGISGGGAISNVTTVATNTDTAATLGTPAGASIAADIAAISAGSGLDAAGVRSAIGLASANLDTQLGTLATTAALTTVDTVVDGIKAKTDSLTFTTAGQVDANAQYWNDAAITTPLEDSSDVATAVATELGTGSAFTALPWNALWDAEVQSEVADALAAIYLDQLFSASYNSATPPGNAAAFLNELTENNSGATRFTAGALAQAPSGTGASAASIRAEMDANSTQLAKLGTPAGASISADIAALNDLDAAGVRAAVGLASANLDTQLGTLATSSALGTAQADLDTITGSDGVTLATSQANYAPATAAALATAQTDLDTITGSDGVTLATTQGNYAPSTAAALATVDNKIGVIDGIVDNILTDTGTTIPATLGTPTDGDLATDIANLAALLGISEPGSVPNFSGDAGDALSWLLALSRNKIQQTSTTKTIRNDADTADIATCVVSDNGTTFQRSECQ